MVERLTKTKVRSLIQISCLITLTACMWIFPVSEATSFNTTSAITDSVPQLRVYKELNTTQVDVGEFLLVTITITNLSNSTANQVHSIDTIFPTWAFSIEGTPEHIWNSLESLSSVEYSYLLSPNRAGTFQLQRSYVYYSISDGSIFRTALSNEITLQVSPKEVLSPDRNVEGLQTILFAEFALLSLLLVAIITRRISTNPKTARE